MSNQSSRGLSTAVDRWSGLGPYYAMFPVQFAFEVVAQFAPPDGSVLDPFAGRGSSVYAAATTGRTGYGIEINPVGWLYGRVKLDPANEKSVLRRLNEMGRSATTISVDRVASLPPFFRRCYAPDVLRFLLAVRDHLRWQTSKTDATLMGILLVYLHGKRDASLSNQMRQGKAMSPDYSVRWWDEHDLDPPDLDPVSFLEQRIRWRYAKGRPDMQSSRMVFGDSERVLPRLRPPRPFDLLFTSPPYYSITNYHYDQWLRRWAMGGPYRPTKSAGRWQAKFESKTAYIHLLKNVFVRSARLMARDATVYVRTDARPFTFTVTLAALREAFPNKELIVTPRPMIRQGQTALYGDKEPKPGEVDLILQPS